MPAIKTAIKTATRPAAKPAGKTAVKTAAKTATKTAARKSVATKVAAPKVAQPKALDVLKAPAVAEVKAPKPDKVKLIRDSFTMPRDDWALIQQLKDRSLDFKRPVKKSELLRAGLQALMKLDNTQLQAALEGLRPLKLGRPKK